MTNPGNHPSDVLVSAPACHEPSCRASPQPGAASIGTSGSPKRVVIVGGGFAGVYTAMALERALGRRNDFTIDLVNRENYFVFQPMLPEIISGSIGIVDPVSPIRRLLRRTALHVRDVEAIEFQDRVVRCSPGFLPRPHCLSYDYLVLALGAVTDFQKLPGLAAHARAFTNLGDALALRNHVIRIFEEAAIESDPEERQRLLTFVVAGGGFSGVEVVAELNDFVRKIARTYRSINPAEIQVILLHSRDRILPEVTPALAAIAQRSLARRRVEIRLHTRIAAASGSEAILSTGERIGTKTLVSTVPSAPNPLLHTLDVPKHRDRVQVNSFLEVEAVPGVWALGDCANIPPPGGEGVVPPTAQHAIREARVAAHNIVAAIRGGPKEPFRFKGLGQMASLGQRSGVAQILGVSLSGFAAWVLWRMIYLAKLPGLDRKLKVGLAWTLDLFFPPDIVQLKLEASRAIASEHFEPGEDVFHQGDLGDRLYIIIKGTAEVVREDPAGSHVLARLGPGEYFGEMALLSKKSRSATVRCVEPMDVLSLRQADFGALVAYLPGMGESIHKVVAQRTQADEGVRQPAAGQVE